jgi:hypothetical protein
MTRDELVMHLILNRCLYQKRVGPRSFYKNERNGRVCGIDDRKDPDNAYVYWACKTLFIPQPDGIEAHVVKDLDDFDRGAERENRR